MNNNQQLDKLSSLPTEVLEKVFSFLGPNDKKNLLSSNKSLHSLRIMQIRRDVNEGVSIKLRVPKHIKKHDLLTELMSVKEHLISLAERENKEKKISFGINCSRLSLDDSIFEKISKLFGERLHSIYCNESYSSENFICDHSIRSLAINCPNLSEVNFSNCHNITDIAIKALASGCPNLSKIDLSYCSKITDIGIKELAIGCPNLSKINLLTTGICVDGCEITDMGIKALANGCPNLSEVNLFSRREITDVAIEVLASGCPNLSEVNLSNCHNITDIGINALGNGCPNLSRIDLPRCYNITDIGINALGNGCPNLSEINLFGCRKITNVAIKKLATGCPNLSKVNLSNCPELTDIAVEDLIMNCQNISFIVIFQKKSDSDYIERVMEREWIDSFRKKLLSKKVQSVVSPENVTEIYVSRMIQ